MQDTDYTEGQRHLGAALGSVSFKESCVSEKVKQCFKELEQLTKIVTSQPQSAYSAYVNGYKHKFTYFVRTVPDIAIQLQPIENLIHTKLLPAILNSDISSLDRSLFTLPTKYGGLGTPNIVEDTDFEYEMSKTLSAPLAALIVIQSQNRLREEPTSMELKNGIIRQRETRLKQQVETIDEKRPPEMIKTITQARDKGSSNWLNVLPLEE